jgi:hypothetical protein
MNPQIRAKLSEVRQSLQESDASSTAGEILQGALDELNDRFSELGREIRDLETAWSKWDFDYLLKHKYLSSSLVKELKAERDYVYGK